MTFLVKKTYSLGTFKTCKRADMLFADNSLMLQTKENTTGHRWTLLIGPLDEYETRESAKMRPIWDLKI